MANQEDRLPADARRYISNLASIGVPPPYAVIVSLLGVKNFSLNLARNPVYAWDSDFGIPFDRDQLHFREVIFDSMPGNQEEAATVMRQILEQMANAAGQPASRSFDQNGAYIPLRT
jgi:hypothetical protein